MSKRGKCPSLISGSNGKPRIECAKGKRHCKRCGKDILKGENCSSIPNPRKMNSRTTYCVDCYKEILRKSKVDLESLNAELLIIQKS